MQTRKTFTSLAIDNPAELLFGRAPHPVRTRQGLVIGGGTVYPELNFTLPPVSIEAATMPAIRRQYRAIIRSAGERAAALAAPGLVVEFETLPPMVENPVWGIELTGILLEELEKLRQSHGLPSALRITPNDTREMERPPRLRQGPWLAGMLEVFEGTARLGAELLSIESVGGKELHDEALTNCDLPGVIFSQAVLGVRDMDFLWTRLKDIADRHGVICAGDTACGFANTAMVLADRGMIPRVFAAVVRAVSAVRSLVAYACGAVGPGKDCGYENVFLKAITGCPMSMEGKTAACAHLSAVGNIAAAACDLWSNESVQDIKLLSGMAPTCFMEQLIYDCRLMNTAAADGPAAARQLRDWLVKSDARLDPQAFILAPENVLAIARVIVAAPGHYQAACAAAEKTISLLEEGGRAGMVCISPREQPWLARMREALAELPGREDDFIAQMLPLVDAQRCRLSEYGL